LAKEVLFAPSLEDGSVEPLEEQRVATLSEEFPASLESRPSHAGSEARGRREPLWRAILHQGKAITVGPLFSQENGRAGFAGLEEEPFQLQIHLCSRQDEALGLREFATP